jgi:hypothetical protein
MKKEHVNENKENTRKMSKGRQFTKAQTQFNKHIRYSIAIKKIQTEKAMTTFFRETKLRTLPILRYNLLEWLKMDVAKF